MDGYYIQALAGERLKRCYDIAPPRVQQYLEAEIEHAASLAAPTDTVLELGCGYGRILTRLARVSYAAFGVDTSLASLEFGATKIKKQSNCHVVCADAARLPFTHSQFDKVYCLQNGISAFKLETLSLLNECLRVLKPDGLIVFSTYAEGFWQNRLAWFRIQADAGLVGPIDEARTGRGVIVCSDGFSARTATVEEFRTLADLTGAVFRTYEVDSSSLFAEFHR